MLFFVTIATDDIILVSLEAYCTFHKVLSDNSIFCMSQRFCNTNKMQILFCETVC